jgi:diguanylate cyclase (GGDEF)-like protein
MMDSYERNYRYLLLNLIPQHRLTPGLRRDVELALVSGKSEDLRRQSILALEELCTSNYLARVGLRRVNGDIIAEYRRKGGRFMVSVAVPAQEWERYIAGDHSATPLQTERPPPRATSHEVNSTQTPPPMVEVPGPDLLRYLPEITQVFSISSRADSIVNRLELLLGILVNWLDVRSLRLSLLEEIANMTDITTDWVETVSEDDLRASSLYRACIESGLQRLVPRAKSSDAPIEDAPTDWEYLGLSPVYSAGKVCGVLKMYFGGDVDEVTKKLRLEAATSLVKQAIEFTSKVETITSVDALTQIYNRHFYDSQVSVEIERATRSGNEVSMLVIDLDDFKRVNDDLGHKKGDEALSNVADLIRSNLRKVDLPFRYGGEEFVILLPGTSEFESVHTAERLRRVVAEFTGFKNPSASGYRCIRIRRRRRTSCSNRRTRQCFVRKDSEKTEWYCINRV